jgi:hypothetical protein
VVSRSASDHADIDLVYTDDWTKSSGRLHHLAFATDTREDILRAADICLDKGVFIETGPHKHAIQQTFFLYLYEPGGNRIELCNPCARLIFAPDWAPISWTQQERARGQAWGLATIGSFHTHGTPLPGPPGSAAARKLVRSVFYQRTGGRDHGGAPRGSRGRRSRPAISYSALMRLESSVLRNAKSLFTRAGLAPLAITICWSR